VASEEAFGGCGVGVIAVADDVTLVDSGEGFEDFGMHSGVVVAGEAAGWFHHRCITVSNIAVTSRGHGL
jgi:hypothetical protein